MNKSLSRISLAIAASAAALAIAQSPQPRPAPAYVDEPVASVAAGLATPDEQLNAIAQGLAADTSLKGSKITVVRDSENVVLLTGVTTTRAQMKRALEVASQNANGGTVGNALTSEELVIDPQGPTASSQAMVAAPESTAAMADAAVATSDATAPAGSSAAAPAPEAAAPAPEGKAATPTT